MKKINKVLSALFITVCMLCMTSVAVMATPKLVQTAATQTSLTFTWTDAAISYGNYSYSPITVKVGTTYDEDESRAIGTVNWANSGSFTINNLKPGMRYYIDLKATYKTEYDEPGDEPNEVYFPTLTTKTLPGKVTNLRQEKWWYFIEQFEAVWDKQTGVSGYEYICKDNKGKVKTSGKINSYSDYSEAANELTVYKINNAVIYTVQVRAFTVFNGRTYYGDWSDLHYFFTQPRITYCKTNGSNLVVKWNKVGGATGYDVYVSTKAKTGYKKVKSVKAGAGSVSIAKVGGKKINKKKTYYVYVATKKGKADSGKLYYWNSKGGSFEYL